MRSCKATTKTGEPCGAPPLADKDFCFWHDPESAADRAAARKLGGARRQVPHAGDPSTVPDQIRDVDGVLALLDYAKDEAMRLANGVPRGRLLVSIATAYSAAFEAGEFESRLANLERIISENGKITEYSFN